MNKIKKISIIAIILYMFFITSSFASTATIEVNSARLREEANTTSKVLTNIYKGEKVEILEKNGEWYKVKYGSTTGYLKNTLIKEDTEKVDKKEEKQEDKNANKEVNENSITNDSATQTTSNKAIANSTLNIRYQPNMMSNIISTVEDGTELSKITKLGNWYQVSDGKITGWVLEEKVNISSTQTDSTPNESNKVEDKNEISNKTNTIKETNTVNENKISNTVKNTNTTNTAISTNTTNTTTSKPQNQETSVNKKAKVNVETAKVRKSADKTSKVVGFLDYNDEITIIAEDGEWYKFTEKDTAGYVHKTLVTVIGEEAISSRGTNEDRESHKENSKSENTTSKTNESYKTENANNAISNKGQEVVELAKKYLGYKYVVGGKNPESGFDCSGFTRYIYLQFGYSLGSTASGQNNLGVEVSRENLKPGDLILFYDEGKTKIGHTGIYISNGDFVHSANPKRGVVIDNLNTNSYYNERYIVAKRIVE